MPHAVTLHLGNKEGDIPRAVEGRFEDNEWERLNRFVEYAKALANIELVRE